MSDPWDKPSADLPTTVKELAQFASYHYQQLTDRGMPAELAAQLTRDLHMEATRHLILDAPSRQPLTDLRIPKPSGWSTEHASRAQALHSPAQD